jgi:hypothetical protein
METNQSCHELKDFLNVERDIILKHIDEHKWFNHISDKNVAIADFIEKYAWLIREVYCKCLCDKEEDCAVLSSLEKK